MLKTKLLEDWNCHKQERDEHGWGQVYCPRTWLRSLLVPHRRRPYTAPARSGQTPGL